MRLGNLAVKTLLVGFLLVLASLLASCGGGGGGGGAAPPANPAGSWGTLVWDQGNWQ